MSADEAAYPDSDPATWCRVLAVGPACPHPCRDCRGSATTMGDLTPSEPSC